MTDCTTDDDNLVLAASQGKVLQDQITGISDRVVALETKTSNMTQNANHTVYTNTHLDVVHGDINVGNSSKDGEAGMYCETSASKIKVLASANGNRGLFDNTTGFWIIQKAADGNVYLNRNGLTWSRNADNGTERPVVGGSGAGDNAVAYFSSWATGLGVYARFGTNSFSTKSLSLATSDRRLKENIKSNTKSGLGLINALDVKQFDWKDGHGHWDYGIIAQEARELDPNLVIGEEKEDSYLSIDTLYLTDALVKAVQELTVEVEKLKAEVECLKHSKADK